MLNRNLPDDPELNAPAGDDWLTRLTQYQYSAGGLGPLWGPFAGNAPGETRYVNPYSSQSPFYNSGLAGTGRATDSPWSMGGAAGTPAAAAGSGGASGGGAGGVGLGAASGVGKAGGLGGLFGGLGAKDYLAMAAAVGPLLAGRVGGTGDLPYGSEMERLIAELTKQQQQADPLRQALLSWAQGLVPTYARG